MYSQVRRGALSEEDWAKYDTIIGFYMAQVGSQKFWESMSESFAKPFEEYVNQVAHKKHNIWREQSTNDSAN